MKILKSLICSLLLASLMVLTGCEEESVLLEKKDRCADAQLETSRYASPQEVDNVVAYITNGTTNTPLSRSSYEIEALKDADGSPLMYVFNKTDGNGFVIVSAIKDFWPVLAYSDAGSFRLDGSTNEALIHWHKSVSDAIRLSDSAPADSIVKIHDHWKRFQPQHIASKAPVSRSPQPGTLDPDIQARLNKIMVDSLESWRSKKYNVYTLQEYRKINPEKYPEVEDMVKCSIWPEYEQCYEDLAVVIEANDSYLVSGGTPIKDEWHQKDPFNKSFPYIPFNGRAKVGCAGVSAGLIMHRYKMPARFDWNRIDTDEKYRSDFLFEFVDQCSPNYLSTGTYIKPDSLKFVLNTFGYNASLSKFNSSTAITEIEHGMPIIALSEMKSKDGTNDYHSYVISGYEYQVATSRIDMWCFADPFRLRNYHIDSNTTSSAHLYYINWGWKRNEFDGSTSNGYYLNIYNPLPFASTEITSNVNYDMIHNIKPK